MNMKPQPLVSVVTPVFNGGKFLGECIDSVLAQTYTNWEYVIVDNCSTDATLEIAQRYAAADPRIRVYHNDVLLDLPANHNRAFSLISPDSKYCKVVSADDWLFPICLEQMVGVAEANPSVGLVGSYQLSGGGSNWRSWNVRWDQVPYPSGVVRGPEISRLYMMGGIEVFGSPTSLLYRADIVRRHPRFFPNDAIHSDTSACCMTLLESDYAFVHQVLSYERVHCIRATAECLSLNSYLPCHLGDVLEYGASCLTPAERQQAIRRLLGQYYDFLAISALKRRGRAFWAYHKERLNKLGYPMNRPRLTMAIGKTLCGILLNPAYASRLVAKRLAFAA
jgi:glycosyltransferase involved in cell wall biosynthesis